MEFRKVSIVFVVFFACDYLCFIEHRNMPIEDAFLLITRNFDGYMRGEQMGRNSNGTGVNSLSDRHPESIQVYTIFNHLRF